MRELDDALDRPHRDARTADAPPDAVRARVLAAAADAITATDQPLAPGQYRCTATHQWTSIGSGERTTAGAQPHDSRVAPAR